MKRSAQFRAAVFLLLGGLLLAGAVASLLLGSNHIPVSELRAATPGSVAWSVLHEQRIPRTLLLITVGAALGAAGVLMQSLTRNPLADPGLLGVNAGAAIGVVSAVAMFGISSIWFYLWFAFAGAALASVAVFILGGIGYSSPARLALAGVALSMAISAIVQMVILSNQHAFNEFRFWAAGSAEGRGMDIVTAIIGFVILGLVLAMGTSPALNALALGEDTSSSLGVRLQRTRILVMLAVTLLSGSATAAVGPIMFVGLAVPFLARAVMGSDIRWLLPFSAAAAPLMMLAADVLARLILAPQEIQVGIMTALLGGPVFIYLVRRPRIEAM